MPLYEWHKIAENVAEISFATTGIAAMNVGEHRFCIAQRKSELFAFAQSCPHAGGAMAEGFLDALGNVVCPLHGYRFNLKNGRNTSGEGYYLRHWPVEQREDGIYIGLTAPA